MSNSLLARVDIACRMVANVYGRDWDAFLTVNAGALSLYLSLTYQPLHVPRPTLPWVTATNQHIYGADVEIFRQRAAKVQG